MRSDTDAVGGFFEDLPVLAFVLAGVLSVAGTASWASEQLSEEGRYEALERSASQLVTGVVLELQKTDGMPTIEAVRCADLSGPMDKLPDGVASLVSIWCVHPENECLLTVPSCESEPQVARSGSTLLNALCDGGAIGILEVRVLVWEA